MINKRPNCPTVTSAVRLGRGRPTRPRCRRSAPDHPRAKGSDAGDVIDADQPNGQPTHQQPGLSRPHPRDHRRRQPRDLHPPVVLAERALDVPEPRASERPASRAGDAAGHLGNEVPAAEQLEAAQDGLVAHPSEEERAAPAEHEPVGALTPERLGLAVGLEGTEDDDRARPPLGENRREGGAAARCSRPRRGRGAEAEEARGSVSGQRSAGRRSGSPRRGGRRAARGSPGRRWGRRRRRCSGGRGTRRGRSRRRRSGPPGGGASAAGVPRPSAEPILTIDNHHVSLARTPAAWYRHRP